MITVKKTKFKWLPSAWKNGNCEDHHLFQSASTMLVWMNQGKSSTVISMKSVKTATSLKSHEIKQKSSCVSLKTLPRQISLSWKHFQRKLHFLWWLSITTCSRSLFNRSISLMANCRLKDTTTKLWNLSSPNIIRSQQVGGVPKCIRNVKLSVKWMILHSGKSPLNLKLH